ncbi:MAG: type II toxin-antitoxin system RelE/ParE family toxin [Oscillospiraceae bacterium]|nr:type II toxin-antitoxin system RelE/ParE family toxin [Oscillospiraceae bacterium]
MQIKYSKDALKFIAKLEAKQAKRIREAVKGLTKSPPEGDIKLLSGYNDGRMRLRIGGWRVIFRFGAENEIEILFVLDIGNRGDIYK